MEIIITIDRVVRIQCVKYVSEFRSMKGTQWALSKTSVPESTGTNVSVFTDVSGLEARMQIGN